MLLLDSSQGIDVISSRRRGRAAAAADYSPYANVEYPTRVLWGDTHLHTTNSLDARLSRPLDFLVVTDHSDLLGVMDQLLLGNPALLEHAQIRDLYDKLMAGGDESAQALEVIGNVLDGDYTGPLLDKALMRSVWERYVEVADRFNDPGRFTALIGYEWTPTNSGDKLHRNVLYRGNADKARRLFPFTANDSLTMPDSESPQSDAGDCRKTELPRAKVSITGMSARAPGSAVSGFASRITRSARFPGVIDPLLSSSKYW